MEDTCPMCESTFDSTKYKIVECEVCGAEGSTACCMPQVNGSDVLCHNCEDWEEDRRG